MTIELGDLVTLYVQHRQAMGQKFIANEKVLRSFCRSAGSKTSMLEIGEPEVLQFLNGSGTFSNAWHNRYSALNGFFRFAAARQYVVVPEKGAVGRRAYQVVSSAGSRRCVRR